MSNHEQRFRSQAERQRDEALRCHYGRIGIQAVAAAKAVAPQTKQSGNVDRLPTWVSNGRTSTKM